MNATQSKRLRFEDPEAHALGWKWTALAILAVAFSVRLVHVFQIRAAPFFTLLMGDSRSYDSWATRIAAGDWIGRDVFYQAPLYPYFLGVIYAIAGRNLMIVRIVQATLGSISCVLLADGARRVFGRADKGSQGRHNGAGVVAGLVLALWAPAIFFDGLLQKSVLDVFFVCLTIWLVSQVGHEGRVGRVGQVGRVGHVGRVGRGRVGRAGLLWLGLGLAVGGLSLTRENALVFVFVLVMWALLQPRPIVTAALFLAGWAIVVGPVAARNSHLGGGFYVTTSQFGPNLYIGNNPRADGTYASLRYGRGAPEYERQDATELAERALGRRLSPGQVSDYWTDRALAFITSQPREWMSLLARKFALLWNATEIVDTESQETHAEWSWPLRILGPITHFGVLVPAAVLGVMLMWRTFHEHRPLNVLLVLAITYAASVLVFYVFARYRYPLVPLLIVFAAGAAVELARRIRRGERDTAQLSSAGALWTVSAVVLVVAVFTNWPLVPRDWMRAVSENNIGVALQAERRYDEAISRYERSIAYRPDYAPALNNLATAYRASGRVDEALATYRRALEVQPDFPDAEYNLANALLDRGAADEAVGRFETALRSLPDSPDVHNNLGTALATEGRVDEAVREFQRALDLDPESAVAHRNLGDLLAAKGDRAGALDHLRRAVRADPGNGDAHYDLGLTLLEAGAVDDAVIEFRSAVQLMPSSAEAHNNLGIALGSQGHLDEAIVEFRAALRLKPNLVDAQRNLAMAEAARRGAAERPQKGAAPRR